MKRPMILCAAFCIALSLCVLNFNTNIIVSFVALSFMLLVTFCVFKRTRKAAIIVAFVFLYLLNTARIKLNYIDKLKDLDGAQVSVNAVVTEVERRSKFTLVSLKIKDSTELPKGTKLHLTNYKDDISVGNEISADIIVSGIDDSVYKKSNYSSGVFVSGYIKQVTNKEYGHNIYHTLANFKAKVSNILFSNTSYTNASFVAALTVGESSYITDDLYRCVKASGVSHVIVVSGMHMAIICGSIYKLLNKIKCNKQLAATFTILFMVFFMALCGFTASVLRAGFMYGICMLSHILLKKRDVLNSLSIAVTVMLIVNPFLIWNVGFLLSAASTFGIIVILPRIEEYIDRYVKNGVINPLLKLSSVTLSALIMTIPISVYYFGIISLVSIFTNICISFAVTILLVLSVVGLLLALLTGSNFLVSLLFSGVEILSTGIVGVIKFFGNLSFASTPCEMWVIAIPYILVIAILLILKYTNIIKKKGSV